MTSLIDSRLAIYCTAFIAVPSAFANNGTPLKELPLSQVLADEAAIIATQSESYQLVMTSIQTRDNAVVEAITPHHPNNPSNVKRVERIVSEQDWDYLFAERDPAYTHLNFLKAVAKYPALCGDYSDGRDADAICRKTLATMFAHFTQETGGHNAYSEIPQWRQGLYYLREIGWQETTSGGYGLCDPQTWQGQAYPCGKNPDGSNKSYFGRGSKQLSYNYNYGPFSQSIYGNVEKLLNEPELVADTWLNLASAVFFYLYPQPPKPSMLHVIDGTWQPNERDKQNGLVPGFGVTTQIINGGVECGGSAEHIQSQNRIDYYRQFAKHLNVPIAPNEVLGCKGMKQFDDGGAGALNIFWEENWGWDAESSDGRTYQCQLVSYQGSYSSFIEGDYAKCVASKFNVDIIDDTNGNRAPIANAGQDHQVEATEAVTITVSASQSSDDKGIVSYQWQQTDGSNIPLQLSAPNAETTQVQVPALERSQVFNLTLTVADAEGKTAQDTVAIVANVTNSNQAPKVVLHAPKEVNEEFIGVKVHATVSDPENDAVQLNWQVSQNISFTVAHDQRSIIFDAPAVTHDTPISVQVEAIDEAQNMVSSSVTITVKNNQQDGGQCEAIDPNANQYSAYQSDKVYTETSSPVSHLGLVYKAKWWVQGNEPTPANEAWELLSTVELPWSIEAVYNGGDEVNWQGKRWQAQWWTKGDKPGVAGVWVDVGAASCPS
ncbi:hypothetical protein HGP28_04450 [Vibrio sp. SM6]|uniref:Chitinase n=1 Tax=Vibrio agarilyticus TaxID=2726741 RepID=A0A7X8YFY8_9VIBR|nr:glycoside hydrolase family 19 protein [Vibrio agarilyticus]NLS12144.1 hypothetical protein [Vibrio agarilyticus]